MTAGALLAPEQDDGEQSALKEAMEILREVLGEGPADGKRVQREASEAGITDRTLRRAKTALGVKSKREGGLGPAGRWVWSLP